MGGGGGLIEGGDNFKHFHSNGGGGEALIRGTAIICENTVFIWSADWFIALSASVVIGQSKYFVFLLSAVNARGFDALCLAVTLLKLL